MTRKPGTLFGIGLGPGAPDLMSLRAAHRIATCDVIAYPAARSGQSLARSIAADFINPDGIEMEFAVPMSVDRAPAQTAYDEAAAAIAAHLAAGRDVGVLCEGDPLFFGSFMYLAARLPGETIDIIPGIASPMAAASAAQLALVARDQTLAVVPATLDDAVLIDHLSRHDTIVFMKLGRHFPRLRALIDAQGLTEHTTYIARASGPDETILPLALAPETAPYFALLILQKEKDPWL